MSGSGYPKFRNDRAGKVAIVTGAASDLGPAGCFMVMRLTMRPSVMAEFTLPLPLRWNEEEREWGAAACGRPTVRFLARGPRLGAK
jgi:hypothetical protein